MLTLQAGLWLDQMQSLHSSCPSPVCRSEQPPAAGALLSSASLACTARILHAVAVPPFPGTSAGMPHPQLEAGLYTMPVSDACSICTVTVNMELPLEQS